MIDHPTGAGPIWRLYLATVVGCTGKKSSAAAEFWGPNIGAWAPPGSVRAPPLGSARPVVYDAKVIGSIIKACVTSQRLKQKMSPPSLIRKKMTDMKIGQRPKKSWQ